MSSPPFAGRSSFPHVKGTKERIDGFKAQQEGGFAQFHGALFQIMTGKFAARIFNELLNVDACSSNPTLQRACAHAAFSSAFLQLRTPSAQRWPDARLHLCSSI